VRLTAWEEERLTLFAAAELARRHRAAGIRLNAPEAVALICDAMLETARRGATHAEVEAAGRAAVAPADVLDGVAELVDDIRLEVLLGDGTRLIVLVDPIAAGRAADRRGPGAIVAAPEGGASRGDFAERDRRRLVVRSTSRRTIRVSSHQPFDRVNARLEFDRAAAAGHRLDLPAGAIVTWAPGETRELVLVRFGGSGGSGDGGRGGGAGA
jgi:urease subunit gamma/beta